MLARPFFNLSFYTAICVIVCFTAIGACGTAFIATLGPLTGLRTMVICRYSMGFIGASIFSFLNILTHLGCVPSSAKLQCLVIFDLVWTFLLA